MRRSARIAVIILVANVIGVPTHDVSALDLQSGTRLLEKIVRVQERQGTRAAYRYYDALSRIEQAKVRLAVKRMEIKYILKTRRGSRDDPPRKPRTATSASGGQMTTSQYACWGPETISFKGEGPWPFYRDLFEIRQQVNWCGDGVRVTSDCSAPAGGYLEEYARPWKYTGAVSGPCNRVINWANSQKWEFEAMFQACYGLSAEGYGFDCVDSATPYVAQQVGPTADAYWSFSG